MDICNPVDKFNAASSNRISKSLDVKESEHGKQKHCLSLVMERQALVVWTSCPSQSRSPLGGCLRGLKRHGLAEGSVSLQADSES